MSGDTGFGERIMGHTELEQRLVKERSLARRQCERVIVLLRELRESEEQMLLHPSRPSVLGRWAAAMELADTFLQQWTANGPRWSLDKPLKTHKGVELTEEKIEQVAAKFEAGIDPEKLRPRPDKT